MQPPSFRPPAALWRSLSILLLAASANTQTAAKFVDFLQSVPAQAVLAKYGFGRP